MTWEEERLAVHKNAIIRLLKENPEEWPSLVLRFPGSREEFIRALEECPRQWFLDGRLVSDEEMATAMNNGGRNG